jgi:hypothetical protein
MGNIKKLRNYIVFHIQVMSSCCTTMGIYDNGTAMKKLKHYTVFHTRSCVPAVRGWEHKKMAYKEDAEELYCFTVYENGIQGRR